MRARAPGARVRPAVFLVARADGALDCWDYLADQATPALTLQVAPAPPARARPPAWPGPCVRAAEPAQRTRAARHTGAAPGHGPGVRRQRPPRAGCAKNVFNRLFLRTARAAARQVSPRALTALRVHDAGRLAALGAADGSTAILQLSDGLTELQPNEKAAFAAVRPPSPGPATQVGLAGLLERGA